MGFQPNTKTAGNLEQFPAAFRIFFALFGPSIITQARKEISLFFLLFYFFLCNGYRSSLPCSSAFIGKAIIKSISVIANGIPVQQNSR